MPFAIDEADKLFNKHVYVSAALWQMWRTREDCMTAESGLDHMPGSREEPGPGPAKVSSDVSPVQSSNLAATTKLAPRTLTQESRWWT